MAVPPLNLITLAERLFFNTTLKISVRISTGGWRGQGPDECIEFFPVFSNIIEIFSVFMVKIFRKIPTNPYTWRHCIYILTRILFVGIEVVVTNFDEFHRIFNDGNFCTRGLSQPSTNLFLVVVTEFTLEL